ncbi:hypothetical protein Avbf_10437, partial [Armadillidium vulgare]
LLLFISEFSIEKQREFLSNMEQVSISEFLPRFCSGLYLIFLMEGLLRNIKKFRQYRSLNVKGNQILKNLIYKEIQRVFDIYLYTAIVFSYPMLTSSGENMIISIIIVVTSLCYAIRVSKLEFPENICSPRSPRLPRSPRSTGSSIQNQLRENSVQRNKCQNYEEFVSFACLFGLASALIFAAYSKVNENIMIAYFISLFVMITRGEEHKKEKRSCHPSHSRGNSTTSPATSSRVSESPSIQQPKSVNVSTTQTDTNRGVTTVVGGVINNDSSLSIQQVQNKDQKGPQNLQEFKSSEEVPKWFISYMKKFKANCSSKITSKISESFDEAIRNLNETDTDREIKLIEVLASCSIEMRKKVNEEISKVSTQLEVKLEEVAQKLSEINPETQLKGESARSISDQEHKYKKEISEVFSNMQKMLEDVKISISKVFEILTEYVPKMNNKYEKNISEITTQLSERLKAVDKLKANYKSICAFKNKEFMKLSEKIKQKQNKTLKVIDKIPEKVCFPILESAKDFPILKELQIKKSLIKSRNKNENLQNSSLKNKDLEDRIMINERLVKQNHNNKETATYQGIKRGEKEINEENWKEKEGNTNSIEYTGLDHYNSESYSSSECLESNCRSHFDAYSEKRKIDNNNNNCKNWDSSHKNKQNYGEKKEIDAPNEQMQETVDGNGSSEKASETPIIYKNYINSSSTLSPNYENYSNSGESFEMVEGEDCNHPESKTLTSERNKLVFNSQEEF